MPENEKIYLWTRELGKQRSGSLWSQKTHEEKMAKNGNKWGKKHSHR